MPASEKTASRLNGSRISNVYNHGVMGDRGFSDGFSCTGAGYPGKETSRRHETPPVPERHEIPDPT
jgi:hypothetical protein